MWWSARRALSRALDEIEQLRRDVGALQYDLEDAKQRIQRLMWRSKRDAPIPTTTSGDPSEAAPTATDTGASTSGDTAAASANGGRGTTIDPLSARLLARRGRLPTRGPRSSGCADHLVFEDGRPCPNCGQGAFASE